MTEGKGKRRYRRRGPRKPKVGAEAPPGEVPQGAEGMAEGAEEPPRETLPPEGTGEGAPEWGEDPGDAGGEAAESPVEPSPEGSAPKKGRRRSRRRGKKGKGAVAGGGTEAVAFPAETTPPPGADVPDAAGIPPATGVHAPLFFQEPAVAEPMGPETPPPSGEEAGGETAPPGAPGEPGKTGPRRRRPRRRRRGKGQAEGAAQPASARAVVTSMGLTWSSLPVPVDNAGRLLIGIALGAHFTREFFRAAPRFLLAVAAITALYLLLGAGFGLLLASGAGLPWPTAVIATTPGGIGEMALTAKALQLGVPIVTAFHAIRMAAVVITAGYVYSAWRRVQARGGDDD